MPSMGCSSEDRLAGGNRRYDSRRGPRRRRFSTSSATRCASAVRTRPAQPLARRASLRPVRDVSDCLRLVRSHMRRVRMLVAACACLSVAATGRFPLPASGLALTRGFTTGTFFDVVGRRSAAFGYEGRPLEVWVYPLKVVEDLQFSFSAEGYPVAVPEHELPGTIEVRPEATILTRSHAAFTVREIVFAPIDEGAIVILLDIDTVLPMTVIGSFRPSLRPMWPAGSGTANAGWDAAGHAYELSEDSGRFAARVSVPGGVDRSLMPYQAEPRHVPLEFTIDVTPDRARRELVPIVISAGMDGRAAVRATSDRIAADIAGMYRRTVAHYASLIESSAKIETPDARIDRAFEWALVGMDKGL